MSQRKNPHVNYTCNHENSESGTNRLRAYKINRKENHKKSSTSERFAQLSSTKNAVFLDQKLVSQMAFTLTGMPQAECSSRFHAGKPQNLTPSAGNVCRRFCEKDTFLFPQCVGLAKTVAWLAETVHRDWAKEEALYRALRKVSMFYYYRPANRGVTGDTREGGTMPRAPND